MEKSRFPKALGRRLRHLRRLSGRTQATLAESSGVSLEHLNKIERGAAAPSLAVIEAVSRALDVEPAVLFLFTDEAATDDAPAIHWAAAHARLGFFTWQPDSNMVWGAPSLRRLLGSSGKPRLEALPRFLEMTFPRAASQVAAALEALAAPGDRQSLGLLFSRRNGETRHDIMDDLEKPLGKLVDDPDEIARLVPEDRKSVV